MSISPNVSTGTGKNWLEKKVDLIGSPDYLLLVVGAIGNNTNSTGSIFVPWTPKVLRREIMVAIVDLEKGIVRQMIMAMRLKKNLSVVKGATSRHTCDFCGHNDSVGTHLFFQFMHNHPLLDWHLYTEQVW